MRKADDNVTELLARAGQGDRSAFELIVPILYKELRRRAGRLMSEERAQHTLQPTALVHEAYLRLIPEGVEWKDRRHFFAIASRTMRRVLVDSARARRRSKRGGDRKRVEFNESVVSLGDTTVDAIELNDALEKLEERDVRLGRVVELRIFAGLSVEETAAVLEVDPRTVKRRWRDAKALLYRFLSGSSAST